MGHKIRGNNTAITPAMRKWVLENLQRGDMARIAEMAGATPRYVKCIMRERPEVKSQLALTIWVKSYRYLATRKELQEV